MAKQPAQKNEAKSDAPKAERTRASLSMEKRLAIMIGQIKDNAADPAIAAAKTVAKEVTAKAYGAIDTRLKELQTEIAAAAQPAKLTAEGGAQALKDLTQEMSRLQNRRKNLLAQAGA